MEIYRDTSGKKQVITVDTDYLFLRDVVEGLNAKPKRLLSKYFYDDTGDMLFHKITMQPEYYLTCAEHEILQTYSESILSNINAEKGIRIIEPGAGDGFKTRTLIQSLVSGGNGCIYNPIDISTNVLDLLSNSFRKTFPQLLCEPIAGDYSNMNGSIVNDDLKRLLLFLGSNLGNYSPESALDVLQTFGDLLRQGDFFLLGVDLVKDPGRILAAYNDAAGYTAKFNFNLLTRINNELGGHFNISDFMHYPFYNPVKRQAESYLLSRKNQRVWIEAVDSYFDFQQWEPVHTEISRKFTLKEVRSLAEKTGFKTVSDYFDMNGDFCCSLWRK